MGNYPLPKSKKQKIDNLEDVKRLVQEIRDDMKPTAEDIAKAAEIIKRVKKKLHAKQGG